MRKSCIVFKGTRDDDDDDDDNGDDDGYPRRFRYQGRDLKKKMKFALAL
jgi:hypothetical protein